MTTSTIRTKQPAHIFNYSVKGRTLPLSKQDMPSVHLWSYPCWYTAALSNQPSPIRNWTVFLLLMDYRFLSFSSIVQKQCYPMSHSLQVSTTIWKMNVLTWCRSVWTNSLHLIYLIIILRWLIIQWTLGIISFLWDYLLQRLMLQGMASILQGGTLYNS